MGCPEEVYIEDNLVFSICCHDPDTGVLTDADSAPSYRIYEDETGTAILNGAMTKLDDANTTGFYSELIACTAANGFENGKTYTVYIEATVDSDTGGISYAFKALSKTGFPKNTAVSNFPFVMTDSTDHAPLTGLAGTMTIEVKKDGGSFAAAANSSAEEGTTGHYIIDFTAAEFNADFVTLKFTDTGADALTLVIKTIV